jgi:hypothetical protein
MRLFVGARVEPGARLVQDGPTGRDRIPRGRSRGATMDETTKMFLLAGFAGLMCLTSVVLLVGVFVVWSRRQKEAKPPVVGSARVAAVPVSRVPRPGGAPEPRATRSPGVQLPNVSPADMADEEMPTVVVASPTRPSASEGTGTPAGESAKPSSRRSAGATIIAFDEDEDDQD